MDWSLLYGLVSDAAKIPLVAAGLGGLIGGGVGSICTHHFTQKREHTKLLREKAEALILTLSQNRHRLLAWRFALVRRAKHATSPPVERPTAIILDLDHAHAIQLLHFPALRGRLETLEDALISLVTWLEDQWDQQDRDIEEWRRQFYSKEGTPLQDAYLEAYQATVDAIVEASPSCRQLIRTLSRPRGRC